ncbi:MAG: SH3 domain-containing protein [Burkholderiales bacterium]
MRNAILLLFCLCLPATLLAQERGTALKADSLLAEPFADAKKVGAVAKGDVVTILKKTGGWFQVKGPSADGWVRLLSIRRGEAGKASTAKELGGVAALSSGRAGTGQIVSTTGVRGLSAEELKSAKFDVEALNKAERFASSRAEAEAFARDGSLIKRDVGALPDPQAK